MKEAYPPVQESCDDVACLFVKTRQLAIDTVDITSTDTCTNVTTRPPVHAADCDFTLCFSEKRRGLGTVWQQE